MRVSLLALIVVCTLGTTAFAGCMNEELAPPPAVGVPDDPKEVRSEDGRDLRTDLSIDDVLPAPKWQLGERFGVHVYMGPNDQTGTHQNTVVAEDLGGSWLLATDDPETARATSVIDLPIYGEVRKADLATSGFGAEWKLFDFPLKNDKTWSGSFTLPGASEARALAYRVSYAPALPTPQGERPGFLIEGFTVDTDELLIESSYAPAIGWFAHFRAYDLATPDPDDYLFHVINMGHSYDWSGTYYVAESKQVADTFGHIAINPEDPAGSAIGPEPYTTFKVSAEATHLFGIFLAFAFMGATEVVVIDPNHEVTEYRAGWIRQGADPQGPDVVQTYIDQAAIEGEWRVVMLGAGVVTGSGFFLWELIQHERQL